MIPTTARRITRGLEREVPLAELSVEQLVLVQKDDYFPVDGVISEGSTSVDERSITGLESPIEKFPSSRVYAGTRNVGSKVVVRITAIGDDTVAKKIEAFMHEQRQGTKKPSRMQRIAHRLVRRKQPAVHDVLETLATKGVFVAGGDTLKKLRAVDTIVFDKTGIITTGAMHVMHVVSFKPYTQQQVLNMAAALEAHSKHLAAQAIVAFARVHGASALQKVEDPADYGLGIGGNLNGKAMLIGNAALLQRKKIKIPKGALEHKSKGETVVYISAEKDVIGYIVLSNTLKANVKQVMHELKKQYRVVLLSGDFEETAAAIALQANMHEVFADVPGEKRASGIADLRTRGKTVAYVTAANSKLEADVTITMGTRAAFSGDVTILHGDLTAIQTLFEEVKRKK